MLVIRSISIAREGGDFVGANPRVTWKDGYFLTALAPLILALVLSMVVNSTWLGAAYGHSIDVKQHWYAVEHYQPRPYFLLSLPGEGSPLNIVNLFVFFTACWCIYSARRRPSGI